MADALDLEDDSIKRTSWSFGNSFTYEDNFAHYHCPSGSFDTGSVDAGTCKDCLHDRYCKWSKTVTVSDSGSIGTGSETKPKNMNVVYIIKIK